MTMKKNMKYVIRISMCTVASCYKSATVHIDIRITYFIFFFIVILPREPWYAPCNN
jgi:hypothetical protein